MEWAVSSPTSHAAGSSKAISFPLRREEPWLFFLHRDRVVDQSRWVIVFEKEDTVKEGKGIKCLEYEGNLS